MASDAVPPGTRKTIAEMREHPGLKCTRPRDVCRSSDPRACAQRLGFYPRDKLLAHGDALLTLLAFRRCQSTAEKLDQRLKLCFLDHQFTDFSIQRPDPIFTGFDRKSTIPYSSDLTQRLL
jgi:hypothetical protein